MVSQFVTSQARNRKSGGYRTGTSEGTADLIGNFENASIDMSTDDLAAIVKSSITELVTREGGRDKLQEIMAAALYPATSHGNAPMSKAKAGKLFVHIPVAKI